ncbi:MAG: DUF2268 domain-containing putative Zn-dependent protease [Caldisericia bacterium]
MRVFVGLDDIKNLVQPDGKINKRNWEKCYYSKYKKVFDNMLKYLYFSNLETLLQFVENTDFKNLIEKSERAIKEGYIEKILNLIEKSNKILKFNGVFDLYLLVGLSHVDGTAFIGEIPILYFGLERILDSDINFLVPHEFNHLVREVRVFKKNVNMASLKFKEYLIFEGLATYFSIYVNDLKIDKESESKALFLPVEKLDYLYENEKEIFKEIFLSLDEEMNQNLFMEYFTYDGKDRLKFGYFVGLKIIEKLAENELKIVDLTNMDSEEILKIYSKV